MISGLLTAAGVVGAVVFMVGWAKIPSDPSVRSGGIALTGAALMILAALGGLAWHFAG